MLLALFYIADHLFSFGDGSEVGDSSRWLVQFSVSLRPSLTESTVFLGETGW